MSEVNSGVCPLCRGVKTPGTTTFAADLGFGVVVIRDVPALVCDQWGEPWIEDDTAETIEVIAAEARRKRAVVEVVPWPQVA